MLFEKSVYDMTFGDIKDFCSRNEEGYRVEYKSNFDQSVRKNIAKIVSSFANSHGGVLILGVTTSGNKPVDPIAGFEKPASEEIRLTIQNICRQAIYPAMFPAIKEIETDTENRIVVVIKVDESIEAPHAIENSRKVYIRTGDSSDPYDLADLKVMKNLINKRESAEDKIKTFKSYSNKMLESLGMFDDILPYIDIIITPQIPIKPITSKESLYKFCREARFKLDKLIGDLFESNNLRRIHQGILSTQHNERYIYLNENGYLNFLQVCKIKTLDNGNRKSVNVIIFHQLVVELRRSILLFNEFIKENAWNGNVNVQINLYNIKRLAIDFGDINFKHTCLNWNSNAWIESVSDLLETKLVDIISDLLKDLIWCFNQTIDNFEDIEIREKVEKIINN